MLSLQQQFKMCLKPLLYTRFPYSYWRKKFQAFSGTCNYFPQSK